MRYQPSLPEENVNVSHNHPIREFIGLLVVVALAVLLVYWLSGLALDWAVEHIEPEQEKQWFVGVETLGHGQPHKQMQTLLDSLVECANLPVALSLGVQSHPQPNAFAAPGGRVLVHDSLLQSVNSENGLAFVLAHEVGHFKHRDHLRSLGRQLVFGVLVALVAGSDSGLTQLLMPSGALAQAQFSQQREAEADDYALELLNCHYGHVGGAASFFEHQLAQTQHAERLPNTHWLASHPQLQARIEAIQGQTIYPVKAVQPLTITVSEPAIAEEAGPQQ